MRQLAPQCRPNTVRSQGLIQPPLSSSTISMITSHDLQGCKKKNQCAPGAITGLFFKGRQAVKFIFSQLPN